MRGNKYLKIIDIFIGIPTVWLLGILKRKKSVPGKQIVKIGILHTAPIGDTIICSPVIKDLQEKYSKSEIYFFCGKDGFLASKMFLNVNIVLISISNVFRTIRQINEIGKFDIWVDYGPWPRVNSIISYFVLADFKIGFKSRNQYRHYVYDKWIEHRDDVHELVNYRNLIGLIGVNSNSIPFLKLDSSRNSKAVVLHMFPGGYNSHFKRWSENNWIKIAEWLLKNNHEVYITGAKSDLVEGKKNAEEFNTNEHFHNMVGTLTLKETAELIAGSKLIITVNTGIMHMASALNIDVIALHGPTSIKRWGPLSDNAISIKSSINCSPCLHLGFEYGCKCPECMEDISTDEIIELIKYKINNSGNIKSIMNKCYLGNALNISKTQI